MLRPPRWSPRAPTFDFDAEWLPPFRRGDDAFVRAGVMFVNVPLAQEIGTGHARRHKSEITFGSIGTRSNGR